METIPAGRTVVDFTGQLLRTSRVTRFHHAMQVCRDRFLEAAPEALDNYINHSCSPTCRVDFDEQALVSITTIPAGWELTYDYETTEYDLESQGCSFSCKCGSLHCRGRIRGFRFTRLPVKLALQARLSPYLMEKLEEELKLAGDRTTFRAGK